MMRCWDANPMSRPQFSILVEWFEALLSSTDQTNYLQLSKAFDESPDAIQSRPQSVKRTLSNPLRKSSNESRKTYSSPRSGS